MIFVELCPYPSRQFHLDGETVWELAQHDLGFQLAERVRRLLVGRAQPACVLVNGLAAQEQLARIDEGRLALTERRYPSVRRPERSLRHWEGRYVDDGARVPVVAFPFLRKPRTHNSNDEADQLGAHIRELIVAG
jgi:hypothetical protein